MNTPTYEVPTEMRDFAEKSVDQARKAFENFIGAAQKAVGQADTAASSMQNNVRDLSDRTVSFAEQNVRSAFDYAQKVVRVTDVQELMALQTEYVRSQMSTLQEQARAIGSAMQGVAKTGMNTSDQ